jgi:hypothetical protein
MSPGGTLQSFADAIADFLLHALAFGRSRFMAASRFGSPASMIAACGVGVVACAAALATWPAASTAVALSPSVKPVQSVAAYAPAPMGALPPPPVQTALDYDVAYFWPKAPQTVADPVAIRVGPADYAALIRAARPGERLRINGVVEEAPGGPWMRVRMEDGRDGYFAAETMEIGAFRRRRSAERAVEAASSPEATSTSAGAPLVVAGPSEAEVGPPSF